MSMLSAEHISFSAGGHTILEDVGFEANKGELITIVGPNGCGKSTLLKIMSRILRPSSGRVTLLSKEIGAYRPREFAKLLAILPQHKSVPADVTVGQLVQYGRYPHAQFGGRLSKQDFEIVDDALEKTGTARLRGRRVATLSGGEGQMAWIAMALAQTPQIIFLDEPTTYLDICCQLEVLELVKKLNRTLGLTIVMVLHDLNQAARYSDRVFVMKSGKNYVSGTSGEVFCEEVFEKVFGVEMRRLEDQSQNLYYYIPERVLRQVQHER